MICFSLVCDKDHVFEGWFSSSADFDAQKQKGLVSCPQCISVRVDKALMAPSIPSSHTTDEISIAKTDITRQKVIEQMRALQKKITENSEDVGKEFPEEARKIHYGEAETRNIRGKASKDEVNNLLEEGVEILPLPVLPDDAH